MHKQQDAPSLEVFIHVLEVVLAPRLCFDEPLCVCEFALEALHELPIASVLALKQRYVVHVCLERHRHRMIANV